MQPIPSSSSASSQMQPEAIPVLVRDIDAIRQTVDCPISCSPMSNAVSLYPCGHTLDEASAIRLGARNISVHQPDRAIDDPRLPRCPLDRRPVLGYIPSLVTRDVVNQFERVFDGAHVEARPEPADIRAAEERLQAATRAAEEARAETARIAEEARVARAEVVVARNAGAIDRAITNQIIEESTLERIATATALFLAPLATSAAAYLLTPSNLVPSVIPGTSGGWFSSGTPPRVIYTLSNDDRSSNTLLAFASTITTVIAVGSSVYMAHTLRNR
jgi:hypothetical protein